MTDSTTIDDPIPFVAHEALMEDPVGALNAARRVAPLLRTDSFRVAILRAGDVKTLTGHPGIVQIPGARYAEFIEVPQGHTRAFLEQFMLLSNGPDHARRRGAFARAFAHPTIRGLRPRIRAVADDIVAGLPRGEPFDLLERCASPLPARVIAEILGLPSDDSAWFARQVYTLSHILTPTYDPADYDATEAAATALYDFVDTALTERRQAPRDDLLSTLATDESARALAPEELVYQVMGIILGGSDTTRAAFTIAVGLLLADRSRWDEVRAGPDLIPAAIDESLRIEPAVATIPRFTMAPIEIGGMTVAPGQLLAVSTLSAMHDESVHPDPETFDLHRTDRPRHHLVFGLGEHRCLGEMLARIELEEGLSALMAAAPNIEMIEAPRMTGYGGIRRVTPMIARIP